MSGIEIRRIKVDNIAPALSCNWSFVIISFRKCYFLLNPGCLSVGWLIRLRVGWLVCRHNFMKGQEFSLPCVIGALVYILIVCAVLSDCEKRRHRTGSTVQRCCDSLEPSKTIGAFYKKRRCYWLLQVTL